MISRDQSEMEILTLNSEQSSGLLKMPVEIIDYIFDYLELVDLSAVCAVSKQMQHLACRVYQRSYSGLMPIINRSHYDWNIQNFRTPNSCLSNVDLKHFIPFINRMNSCLYDYVHSQTKFHQLTKLVIHSANFNLLQMDELKLGKLIHLQLDRCYMHESFLVNLLSSSPKLRHLSLIDCDAGEKWFERSYPSIEHCEMTSRSIVPIAKLLINNRNIRKFGTNAENLWMNRFPIMAAKVKLDILAITIGASDGLRFNEKIFWSTLYDYYSVGVFKQLNLHLYESASKSFMGVGLLSNFVQENFADKVYRLYVHQYANCHFDGGLKFGVNLEDISLPDSRLVSNINIFAELLRNLKFIYFGISNTNHIKLFVGTNPKLERIRIDWFKNERGTIDDEKVLNLIELDKERAKLPIAKKVTLYVRELVYLATKRANRDTDLEFINLKRTSALRDSEYDFDVPEVYGRS